MNTFDDQSDELCGNDRYPHAVRPIDIVFNHTSPNLIIQILTDISTNSAFWGLFNFSISLHLCDSSCKFYDSEETNHCTSCPMGTYLESDNSCNICNNLTCPIECDETKYYLNFTCLDQCPENCFVENNNNCKVCDNSCKTCNQASNKNCLSCSYPKYLYNGECLLDCPQYYYKNNESHICSRCHHSCITCLDSSDSSCTSCDVKTRQMTNYSINPINSVTT